jgi:hypothetical protein
MTTLRHAIHKSIKEHPRDITDLMRAIALFIPDDHHLTKVATSCFESLKFSPPEHHAWILRQFLGQINAHIPESQVLNGPWWVRAICILITGGSPESDELIASLDRHYSQVFNALEIIVACGQAEKASLYDEEGLEGWRWTHPDGRDWTEVGSWDDGPPVHPVAKIAIELIGEGGKS